MPRDAITPGSVIVFYDGVCGFCNRMVRFLAHRDRRDRFRFASLQGPLAAELLLGHDANPAELDTFYVLVDYGLPDERVYSRARGVLRLFRELGGLWALVGLLGILPASILDAAYDGFAARRYRIFGRYEQCPLPEPGQRRKFVDTVGVVESAPDDRATQSSDM
jgi:predicted DCC family thiol-disulfide oxidoreductase YuxK